MQFPDSFQFNAFFDTELKKHLQHADAIRKKIILNNIVLAIVIIAGFIVETITWMLVGILFIALFVFWFTQTYNISFHVYELYLEKTIFSKTSKFIFAAFHYDHDSYIKLRHLQEGFLISGEPKQYGGKNMISCNAGAMQIQISEITSFSNRLDAAGNKIHEHYFSGLAAYAQINLHLKEPIIILNESELQETLSTLLPGADKNEEGATFFSNYGDEKGFQKYVSPAVWLLIKNYADTTGNKIILTLRDSGIYAGLKNDIAQQHLLFKSALDKAPAKKYFTDVIFLMELFQAIEKIQLAEIRTY